MIQTSKLYTIDRHITEEERKYPDATGEFTRVLHDLTFAIRIIAREVRRAGINDILGMTSNTNVHGEKVKKIDEYANEVIIRAMSHGGQLCAMISEENEEVIAIPKDYKKGKYILAFDPLDGSSNVDVNCPIGTIFSLYKRQSDDDNSDAKPEDLLQTGHQLHAAGYILYSNSTQLVYTTGHGVNVFTYDPTIGEFLLTYENLKIPLYGSYYSVNEAYAPRWSENLQKYLKYVKETSKDKRRPFTSRYVAAAVGDIHRTLITGGVFMYPMDSKRPNGKIRLMYEAAPLSFIVEQAGGKGVDGRGNNILDIKPDNIHMRVPFFAGSAENIDELQQFLDGEHSWLK